MGTYRVLRAVGWTERSMTPEPQPIGDTWNWHFRLNLEMTSEAHLPRLLSCRTEQLRE